MVFTSPCSAVGLRNFRYFSKHSGAKTNHTRSYFVTVKRMPPFPTYLVVYKQLRQHEQETKHIDAYKEAKTNKTLSTNIIKNTLVRSCCELFGEPQVKWSLTRLPKQLRLPRRSH